MLASRTNKTLGSVTLGDDDVIYFFGIPIWGDPENERAGTALDDWDRGIDDDSIFGIPIGGGDEYTSLRNDLRSGLPRSSLRDATGDAEGDRRPQPSKIPSWVLYAGIGLGGLAVVSVIAKNK